MLCTVDASCWENSIVALLSMRINVLHVYYNYHCIIQYFEWCGKYCLGLKLDGEQFEVSHTGTPTVSSFAGQCFARFLLRPWFRREEKHRNKATNSLVDE